MHDAMESNPREVLKQELETAAQIRDALDRASSSEDPHVGLDALREARVLALGLLEQVSWGSPGLRNSWRRIRFSYQGSKGNRLQRLVVGPGEFWTPVDTPSWELADIDVPVVDLGQVDHIMDFDPDTSMRADGRLVYKEDDGVRQSIGSTPIPPGDWTGCRPDPVAESPATR